MRRSQANVPEFQHSANHEVEDENERMTGELKDKIGMLKTLAIDMGSEVKYHHKMLNGLSDDMEHSQGFLAKTMNRVVRLGRGSHNYHLLYLFIFAMFVFVVLWFVLKFR